MIETRGLAIKSLGRSHARKWLYDPSPTFNEQQPIVRMHCTTTGKMSRPGLMSTTNGAALPSMLTSYGLWLPPASYRSTVGTGSAAEANPASNRIY
jgi:hypothetical protein